MNRSDLLQGAGAALNERGVIEIRITKSVELEVTEGCKN